MLNPITRQLWFLNIIAQQTKKKKKIYATKRHNLTRLKYSTKKKQKTFIARHIGRNE